MTRAEQAQLYARMGFRVIPVAWDTPAGCGCGGRIAGCNENSRGKHPLMSMGKGYSKATNDPTTVAKWWEKWPHANIGFACGQGSGFVIVDVDVKSGKRGDVTIGQWAQRGNALPEGAPTWHTPSGGWQMLYQIDEEVRGGVDKLGPGVDVRGEGQYGILPPSATHVGKYAWAEGHSLEECLADRDGSLPPCPGWVVDECRNPSHGKVRQPQQEHSEDWWTPAGDHRHEWLKAVSWNLRQFLPLEANEEITRRLAQQRAMETGRPYDPREVHNLVYGAHQKAPLDYKTQFELTFGATPPPAAMEQRDFTKDHGIELIDLSQVLLAGIEDVEYLFEPLLPLAETTIIAADAKTGKSWIGYALALALAFDRELMGFRMRNGFAGKVAIFQWEMTQRQTLRRLKLLARGLDIALEELAETERLLVPRTPRMLATRSDRRAFVEYVLEHEIEFVLMDSMSAAFSSAGEDLLNDNTKVREVMHETATFLIDRGVTVMGIHHLRKKAAGERSSSSDMQTQILGASAWQQVTSNMLGLVKTGSNGTERHVKLFEIGGWMPVDDFELQIAIRDRDPDSPATRAVLVELLEGSVSVIEGSRDIDRMMRQILALFFEEEAHAVTAEEVVTALGKRKSESVVAFVGKALREMAQNGWLEASRRGRKREYKLTVGGRSIYPHVRDRALEESD